MAFLLSLPFRFKDAWLYSGGIPEGRVPDRRSVSVTEPIMSEKKKPVLFSQLEDALEERQDNDRRKSQKPVLPADVKQDRRKGDRRAGK